MRTKSLMQFGVLALALVAGGSVGAAELSCAGTWDHPANPTRARISRTLARLARSTAAHPETVRVLFYGQSMPRHGSMAIGLTRNRHWGTTLETTEGVHDAAESIAR